MKSGNGACHISFVGIKQVGSIMHESIKTQKCSYKQNYNKLQVYIRGHALEDIKYCDYRQTPGDNRYDKGDIGCYNFFRLFCRLALKCQLGISHQPEKYKRNRYRHPFPVDRSGKDVCEELFYRG